jgi:hypothetical protein
MHNTTSDHSCTATAAVCQCKVIILPPSPNLPERRRDNFDLSLIFTVKLGTGMTRRARLRAEATSRVFKFAGLGFGLSVELSSHTHNLEHIT